MWQSSAKWMHNLEIPQTFLSAIQPLTCRQRGVNRHWNELIIEVGQVESVANYNLYHPISNYIAVDNILVRGEPSKCQIRSVVFLHVAKSSWHARYVFLGTSLLWCSFWWTLRSSRDSFCAAWLLFFWRGSFRRMGKWEWNCWWLKSCTSW